MARSLEKIEGSEIVGRQEMFYIIERYHSFIYLKKLKREKLVANKKGIALTKENKRNSSYKRKQQRFFMEKMLFLLMLVISAACFQNLTPQDVPLKPMASQMFLLFHAELIHDI